MRAQQRAPVRVDLARRGTNPAGGEDAADRASPDPMAETDEFALDAAMPPARVLAGQPQHQIPDVAVDSGPAGPVRIRPPPLDRPPVPGQQRGRRDDAMTPQRSRQGPDQRRQDRPLRPRQSGTTDLTTQHRDLVTQHHQLRDQRGVAPSRPRQAAQHPNCGRVQHPNQHAADPAHRRERPAHSPCESFGTAQGQSKKHSTASSRVSRRRCS
jgi:hypothetical protein